jgi:hypothetical protein
MKKYIGVLLLTCCVAIGFSQSEKYVAAMKQKIAASDTTRNPEALRDFSAAFERIADAEKTQWLPYYYAALTQVNAGYSLTMGKKDNDLVAVVDPIADKADQLISKAEDLSKDNSEIYVVKKMIATLRLMVDPMSRYMKYGPVAQQALEQAQKLNPENPRVFLLRGEDKFYTPEQFGGSKSEAKALFEQALKKFDTYKSASAIDPNWGRNITEYFLSQIK